VFLGEVNEAFNVPNLEVIDIYFCKIEAKGSSFIATERPAIHSYRFAMLILAFQKTIPFLSGLFCTVSNLFQKHFKKPTKILPKKQL